MIRVIKLTAFVVVCLTLSCLTDPGKGGQTIIGSQDPASDVPAVQTAVDKGGTVILEGDFDFGDQGVEITDSVVVQGMRANQEFLACIRNGFNSFLIQEGESGPDIQVTVEDLFFDGATGSAIVIHTGHATARGNRIRNIKYRPTPKKKDFGSGINIGDFGKPGSISEVLIEANDIEINTDYNPKLHYSYGVYIGTIASDALSEEKSPTKKITIRRNVVRDFGEGGLLAVGSRGASLSIAENQIDARPRMAQFGIAAHRDVDSGLEVGPVAILGNSISLAGFWGIGVAIRGATIEDNVVEMLETKAGPVAGISLGGWKGGEGSKENRLVGNRISGSSPRGFLIYGLDKGAPSEGNVIRDNDLSSLKARIAKVQLGEHTRANSIQSISDQDTVMDCGQDNRIEGGQLVECPPVQK